MRSWARTAAWMCGATWLAACAGQASIGADACPRGKKCEVERLVVPQDSSEVHSTGPSLAPAWKASLLEAEGSVVAHVDDHSHLASGPEGTLWLFTPESERFQVAQLDLSGTVVDHATVEPPPGFRVDGRVIADLRCVTSHARGPAVGVEWRIHCSESAPDDPHDCFTSQSELVVFGVGGAEPESRAFPYPINNLVETFETLHRSADGDSVFITSPISGVTKADLHGNIAWQDDLSLDRFDELPNRAALQSGAAPFRSGTVSPDGELVFGIDITAKKSEAWDWRYFAGGLLHIAGDGTQSVRLYENDGQIGSRSSDVLDLGPAAIGELTEGHPHVMLAYDTRRRLLAVYQQLDGDLVVLRIAGDQTESFRIMRESYADLSLYDVAVDPAGTLYISTQGGGREPGSQEPLLCRVPPEGSPDCVSIPSGTYDIEAPAPGMVFALSSELEPELLRFDFE
jgi:hypothetical protein